MDSGGISNDDFLLHPEDAERLQARGLLLASSNGQRKLSSSTMISLSNPESEDSGVDTTHDVVVPQFLDSEASLRFMGFDNWMAAALWDTWKTRDRDFPFDFFTSILKEVRSFKNNAEGLNDEWDNIMKGWGIGEELRTAILDEEFRDLRGTATARFWVLDTIQMAWRVLSRIHWASRERVRTIRQGQDSMKRPDAQYPLPTASPSYLPGGVLSKSTTEAERTPGTVILYKGVDRERTTGINTTTGVYVLSQLGTVPPTDFFGRLGAVFYFVVDKTVAEMYCTYAKRRHGPAITCIVEMEVPNRLIAQAQPVILKDEAWKKVIWYSRRGFPLPKELEHLGRKFITIGNICHSHNRAIPKMESWNEISNENVLYSEDRLLDKATGELRIDRIPAVQYAFWGDDAQPTLEEKCTFRITSSLAK